MLFSDEDLQRFVDGDGEANSSRIAHWLAGVRKEFEEAGFSQAEAFELARDCFNALLDSLPGSEDDE